MNIVLKQINSIRVSVGIPRTMTSKYCLSLTQSYCCVYQGFCCVCGFFYYMRRIIAKYLWYLIQYTGIHHLPSIEFLESSVELSNFS